MKVTDIIGAGKMLPMDKLLDICKSAFGRTGKSYYDKVDANSEAHRIEVLANARAKEIGILAKAVSENGDTTTSIEINDGKLSIKKIPDQSSNGNGISETHTAIQQRAVERFIFREEAKQLNIENVTNFAAQELKGADPVTDEPVDKDWTSRFFNIVEDVSNEEMQALWGRVLAGEIKQPKTFSLRTLETLKNLTQSEAKTFTQVANYSLKYGGETPLFLINEDPELDKYKITNAQHSELVEAGLIHTTDLKLLINKEGKGITVLSINEIGLSIFPSLTNPEIPLYFYDFTKVGIELMKLLDIVPDENYLNAIEKYFINKSAEVKRGKVVIDNGKPLRFEFDDEF